MLLRDFSLYSTPFKLSTLLAPSFLVLRIFADVWSKHEDGQHVNTVAGKRLPGSLYGILYLGSFVTFQAVDLKLMGLETDAPHIPGMGPPPLSDKVP